MDLACFMEFIDFKKSFWLSVTGFLIFIFKLVEAKYCTLTTLNSLF